jgi:isoquinoline 1-oxidoreductase beta subunit
MSRGLLDAQNARAPKGLNRRAFLKLGMSIGATAGGGLMLGFSVPAASQGEALNAKSVVGGDAVEAPQSGVFEPNAFVQIDNTGKVTLVMPKVEMGQGVYTSIPMLIAEELEVSLDSVVIDHAPPNEALFKDPLLGGQLTGGSTSIRYAWEPMRKAGATARVLLVSAAARQWNVDPASCHAERGEVIHDATGRKIGYGQLVDAASKLPAPTNVPLKDPKDFKLIGTVVKRLDSPEKVNGVAVFGLDVRLPDMVYAAIVNSPVFGGTPASVDDTAAKKIPGVRQVIKFDNGVAVIGDHTWAAKRGAAALAIVWNEGAGAHYSTAKVVQELAEASKKDGAVARKDGDIDQGFKDAKTRIDAVYQQPFLSHATMEPVNCTVSVRPDGCDIWVGTQVPTRAVDTAVKITGLPADKITVHNHLLGGGFGRRLETDFIGQALKIGKQLNVPVKVTFTREEDIQHDMYRPYYYDVISAGLDANNKPIAWKHRITGSSILARFAPPAVKNGVDPDAVEVAAQLPYDLPNQLIDYVRQEPQDVPTAFWRGVGPTRGTFVVESFIDELAAAAKVDPVKYRRDLLGKAPRALNVLDVATKAADWGATAPPKGQGRGVSVMNAFGSFFSMVVDLSVNDAGEVAVNRVVCAVDCGMVVNPNTVEAQVQGGIIFGITAALYSEITIKDGRVEQSNFTDYRMLRIDQTPPIEVHIVKSSEAPGGIGEPGTAALAPALTNAIFAATGTRLRQLPVGTQLVRQA